MSYPNLNDSDIFELGRDAWPALLNEIPKPPDQLYCLGVPPPKDGLYLTVIGSRTPTDYGRDSVRKLILGLRGYPIIIVSGLAFGIDSLSHEAALEAGLRTVSFPGSALSSAVLYPFQHHSLADRIIGAGGCLLSEFSEFGGGRWMFPQRNRLMAGIAKATLIIEARLKSGSLITTRLAHDYNRSVLAVPGSINNPLSAGPNMLLRTPTAAAITCAEDILAELGLEAHDPAIIPPERLAALDPDSRRILERLLPGPANKDLLCHELNFSMSDLNTLISLLEIEGLIKTSGNIIRRIT
jgi:DNA processing protein